MDMQDITALIKILEESKLKKLRMKNGNFEVFLEKEDNALKTAYHEPAAAIKEKEALLPVNGKNENAEFIVSPMVGTFYTSPSPDRPLFIKVGDKVEESTIVCIIEAMKVMNEVKANKKGTIVEIMLDNARPVEFGTKLFRIEA